MAQPHFIELDEAAGRIKQACEDRESDSHHPFFFMVGAGLSYPSVPLAADIVSKCKEVAQHYGRGNELAEKDALDTYSYWFQTAYAEPKRRQKYLHELIHGKPVTHANFRLAHLLLSNKISNLVVTTNFDDFLTKALTLFGEPHIVCDHPQTVRRINHNEPRLQIVHLHGSYWFYDCCNLRGEVEERAQQSHQTSSTMASLLNVILWDRSPLVIGYSGWEGDVFMEALKQRLATPLSSNVYWFCYSKSAVDSLPAWTKENPNIWFVVPTPRTVTKPEPNVSEQKSDSHPLAGTIQAKSLGVKKDDEAVLSADTVLHRLIQAFNLEAPELTKDPLGFFALRLENSLPTADASDDIYAIKSVIERVRIAKQREAESDSKQVKPSESTLEDVRDALRRADFREAVKRAANIPLNILDEVSLAELAEAMWSVTNSLLDGSEDEILAYDLVIRVLDKLSERTGTENLETKIKIARSLVLKGLVFNPVNQSEESIAVYDQVFERFNDSDEIEVKQQVADALFNKAVTLEHNNQTEAAIAAYDQIVQRYSDEQQMELQSHVARALVRKGVCLGTLDRTEEELRLYDFVVEEYSETELPAEIAVALFNKAYRVSKLNQKEEAITLYDRIINTFGNSPDPELKELVANSRFNKSVMFGSLNRHEEALSVLQGIIEIYGASTEPLLQKIVGRTLNDMAFYSIVIAKESRLRGDAEASLQQLQQAEMYITHAMVKEGNKALRLGNHAYIAFLLGRKDEAKKLLTQAISLGGEQTRQDEVDDSYINELPEDAQFREMVAAIPSA